MKEMEKRRRKARGSERNQNRKGDMEIWGTRKRTYPHYQSKQEKGELLGYQSIIYCPYKNDLFSHIISERETKH